MLTKALCKFLFMTQCSYSEVMVMVFLSVSRMRNSLLVHCTDEQTDELEGG